MKIIIVMPAYQAQGTIASVIPRIPKDFYSRIDKIVIVNDGSRDRTKETVMSLQKKYKKIVLINHEKNKGYGGAQKTGFRSVLDLGGDIGVLLHSDGQYAPELLPKMVAPIEKGEADVVLGSRILGKTALKGGMPLYKYLGNRFLTFIETIAYGHR